MKDCHHPTPAKYKKGFTLAELLIALAILGVIATFTIPKVLQAQQNATYNALAKEALGTISQGFDLYRRSNTVTATTGAKDLTPYFNYVRVYTSGSTVNNTWGGVSTTCEDEIMCLRLHNGATLRLSDANTFGGTSATNFLWFQVDPDGKYTSGTGHNALGVYLYTNGRLLNEGYCLPNSITHEYGSPPGWCPCVADNTVPAWFSWN